MIYIKFLLLKKSRIERAFLTCIHTEIYTYTYLYILHTFL